MEGDRECRLRITELNPHLICALCGGYLIDATTVVECLHSFCKTCILRYLETSNYCPICEVLIHKTRPWQNIRLDHTLQNIVYKIVPGLFKTEMKRRRDFYDKTPSSADKKGVSGDSKEQTSDRIIYSPDEQISLSLDFCPKGKQDESGQATAALQDRRYLLCPAAVTVSHLKKFIRMKYSLAEKYKIDLFNEEETLRDHYSLMDVAYIYSWRRRGVLRLCYAFYETPAKKRKLSQEEEATTTSKELSENKEIKVETCATPPANPVKETPAASLSNGDIALHASTTDSKSDLAETSDVARNGDLCSKTGDLTPVSDSGATDLRTETTVSKSLQLPNSETSPPGGMVDGKSSSESTATPATTTPTSSSVASSHVVSSNTTTISNCHSPIISRNLKEASDLFRSSPDGHRPTILENGPMRPTLNHASFVGTTPKSPGEPEKSPVKDSRKPSDSADHIFGPRWHQPPDLLFNGHFKIPGNRYGGDMKPDPMPLDYSQSSTSTSS